jgi:UDP-3-O-[3-hydroxymyristoyl] glucosamine N-acyltransferase
MTVNVTLGELAEILGATLRGAADRKITGLATLQEAGPAQLSFLANPQYRKYLVDTQAGAVLLKAADAEAYAGDALLVPDPYLAYARISHLFDPKPKAVAGVHTTALPASVPVPSSKAARSSAPG